MSRPSLAYALSTIAIAGLCIIIAHNVISDDAVTHENTVSPVDIEGDAFAASESESLQKSQTTDSDAVATVHISKEKRFTTDRADSLCTRAGKLVVAEGRLLKDVTLSVRSLSDSELPKMDYGMTNVTPDGEALRLLPHGTHFSKEGASVYLAYDRTKIPSGYTEDDIRTFYFDTESNHWVALERIAVDAKNECVISRTSHFTDMINGVIQAPESPETEGYAPTMMTEVKAADPSLKMNLIAPPTANSRGTASLQYSLEMPPARNGMTPRISIQYSSEGGGGILGEGWNMSIPSITIDTRWGVPRYSEENETETYSMSGSMLVTPDESGEMSVAHRDITPQKRKPDRRFYTRQGGDFSRIIRKGSSPSDYYWEVTDKQGTKYIYGDAEPSGDASLKGKFKDASGNVRDVVSEWHLRRVEELHGDYVEYFYGTVEEKGMGGIASKAHYIKEIHAGNAGQSAHTVVKFVYGKNPKSIRQSNARYGFLTSSDRLLERVDIEFQGALLRSYKFTYKTGAYGRDVLASVSHLDSDGDVASSHAFDYYNDVEADGGFAPFNKEGNTSWNTYDDGLDGGFINPITAVDKWPFSDKPTAMGGTKSRTIGGSLYVGVGPNDASSSTSCTGGGSFSYSNDKSQGVSTLIDINGDGLPDKVFKADGGVYFRPQQQDENGNVTFAAVPIKVKGLSRISTSVSNTFTGGGDAKVGHGNFVATVGAEKSKTKTKTTDYFLDVNGDGLPDFVSNGKVYFNHVVKGSNGTAVPTFSVESSKTENPIVYDVSKIDTSVGEPTEEEQEEVLSNSPMIDMVRVWEAPMDGQVSISGSVSLIAPTGDYDEEEYAKADGVRVAIQKGGKEHWQKSIPKGDTNSYPATAKLEVKKGERIYFRLQSGDDKFSNGAFDNVKWEPVISYTGITEETLPDGYSTITYRTKEGTVPDATIATTVENGRFSLKGKFLKPITTDDVELMVMASNDRLDSEGNENPDYHEVKVFSKRYAWNETADAEDVTKDVVCSEVVTPNGKRYTDLTNIRCEIFSESNIAWERISWTPSITYTDTESGEITKKQGVTYHSYNDIETYGNPYKITTRDTVITATPRLTFIDDAYNGELILTVKSQGRLWERRTLTVKDGKVKDSVLIDCRDLIESQAPLPKLWFDVTSHDTGIGEVVEKSDVLLVNQSQDRDSVTTGLYSKKEQKGFGGMYRGWGGFAYNAGDGRYGKPIDEALLKLPETEESVKETQSTAFQPAALYIDDEGSPVKFIGQRSEVYFTSSMMGAARLSEQDVKLENMFASAAGVEGTSAFAINQQSVSHGDVVLSGVSPMTMSASEGSAETVSTMLDFNGDGYPDIFAGGVIQYTNPLGGISGEKSGNVGTMVSGSEAKSVGLGSAGVVALVKTISHGSGSKDNAAMKGSSDAAKANLSGSGSYSQNNDYAKVTYIDVNGDGLPDKVYKNDNSVHVQFNMGYCFSEPVSLNISKIQDGSSNSFSAGASAGTKQFDNGSSSFSGGLGMAASENHEDFALMDVNADGLPDKVRADDENIKVALNNGYGFANEIVWSGGGLNKSVSTSESLNASFTVCFTPWLIKIAVNPGVFTSHSINRTTYDLRDVDGDGCLDKVESDSEDEMKVTRSAIGRTNMLRCVRNSLGGSFTLDYSKTIPTYDLPGSRYVLSSLTVDDGIHDDGPLMQTTFEYADGKRDRREREFLGFGTVTTNSINTENGLAEGTGSDKIYRRTVVRYDNATVYTQGNILSSSVEDAAGRKFTETSNEYYVYALTATDDSYSFTQKDGYRSDRGAAYVPLRYTANKQYEGGSEGMKVSEAWNSYHTNEGAHGELKTYRYSDKGTLGSEGQGSYDYETSITYTGNEKKHIISLPSDVRVLSSDGTLYHHVTATYDTDYANHITSITQQLDVGNAVTDYEYDRYGNITQKTLPANSKGQRMWYRYRYEPVMNMYPERVDDAWGYRSENENFDYRYGIALLRRDINNYYFETEIDNLGRITKMRAPNEVATGADYTIAFDYHSKAQTSQNDITAPAYAVTRHYDVQHPDDDVETVTFIDGFGRPIQVKKDGVTTEVADGKPSQSRQVMIVSGRNLYDAFGRVVKSYYPTEESTGKKTTFNAAFDDVKPTTTTYDILDRQLTVTLPDGSTSKSEYTLATDMNAMVTTVTDAMGGKQSTYTNGSGKTLRSERLSGPDGVITTSFEYDGIQRLVKVTDTEGNTTTSVYDMGDRRTEVTHPASGKTTFTYDALGNVLTKQTAELAKGDKVITYDYDYHRLSGISYPDHPENNVRYYYGGRNASHNRKGRLELIEDGTGATEYYYGRMGEVTKTRRTLIVPNQAIATYVTQWSYDSQNRLLEMIYPDEEKVTYSYDNGGQLVKVSGYKSYGYDYVSSIGYDKFGQRTYLKYGNGTETTYTYDRLRRRLENLNVSAGGNSIMDNTYTYDAVGNVLGVSNGAKLPETGRVGGNMQHRYEYDALYRLTSATGSYTGSEGKSASYTLKMTYDNMYRVTGKSQHLSQTGVQFDGTLSAGYDLKYTYSGEEGKRFQLAGVDDVNYSAEAVTEDTKVTNAHAYEYDANGNLVFVNTSRTKKDGQTTPNMGERKLKWDEENRLTASDDNGFVTSYWYDASGERTVKSSGENAAMFVNAEFAGGTTNTAKFSLYVSPYLVANQGGRYTKHIYIGSQRIVSKLGDLKSYGADPRRIEYAGSESDGPKVDYKTKYAQQQQVIKDNFAHFDVPYNGADNNDYVDGKGFSEKDGSLKGAMLKAASLKDNFQQSDSYEQYQYFYHPDHLGSSSFITNIEGEVVQHIEYVPYGEVFIEERNNVWNTPYLFNAKEFDEETGLYYYGARYYDSRLSMWYGVDVLTEKYPNIGGYVYCHNNPIMLVDPDGKDDYGVDSKGNIFLVEKNENKTDKLIAGLRQKNGVPKRNRHGELKGLKKDREGNLLNECIEVSKGILGTKRLNLGDYMVIPDMYTQEADNLFEFLVTNTKVEWGYFRIKQTMKNEGTEKEFYTSMISTSHLKYNEKLSPNYLKNYQDDVIVFHTHSHPYDSSVNESKNMSPSEMDTNFWNLHKNVPFSIYSSKYGYYSYGKNSLGEWNVVGKRK